MTEISKYNITPAVARQYATVFENLNDKIDLLNDHLNDDFLITSNKVRKHNSSAREKLFSETITDSLRQKIQQAMRCFHAINAELQYHDIIAEKLARIHRMEADLSREFGLLFENGDTQPEIHFVLVFDDVIRLLLAQVVKIREQYMFTTIKIQRLLRVLWADPDLGRELMLFMFNAADSSKKVLTAIDHIVKSYDALRVPNPGFQVVTSSAERAMILSEIRQSYTQDCERRVFDRMFDAEAGFSVKEQVSL